MSRRSGREREARMPAGLALALIWVAGAACNGGGNNGSGPGGAGGSGGGGGSGGTGGGAMAASFKRDVEPIFKGYCIDCHYRDSIIGYDFGNPFSPDMGIIRRTNSWAGQGSKQSVIVDPGNVGNSFLITKVTETNLDPHIDGAPMPLHIPRLTPAEVAVVEKWITDGASNDAYFTGNVAPIFGTMPSLGGAGGKCTYCHYPNAPSGMNVLNPFDPAQGMVGRASRYGGQIVTPRNPAASVLMKKLTGTTAGAQMPLHRDRLTTDKIDALKAWITAGAENN